MLDQELPGVAEAIRAAGRAATPTAALSRALAGIAGRTIVVNLPGSRGGVADGLARARRAAPAPARPARRRRSRPRASRRPLPATAARVARACMSEPEVLALVTSDPLDRAAIEAFVQTAPTAPS